MKIWESPRRTRLREARAPEPETPPESPEEQSASRKYISAAHRRETRASLSRVREIHKYAKVLPHCSAPVRLNHLSRCSPIRPRQGEESFEALFYRLTDIAR